METTVSITATTTMGTAAVAATVHEVEAVVAAKAQKCDAAVAADGEDEIAMADLPAVVVATIETVRLPLGVPTVLIQVSSHHDVAGDKAHKVDVRVHERTVALSLLSL
jgi:hypothetical protein